jgi:hypothetical protein
MNGAAVNHLGGQGPEYHNISRRLLHEIMIAMTRIRMGVRMLWPSGLSLFLIESIIGFGSSLWHSDAWERG